MSAGGREGTTMLHGHRHRQGTRQPPALLVALGSGALIAAALGLRVSSSLPAPKVEVLTSASVVTAPGSSQPLPWPAAGQAAVGVADVGAGIAGSHGGSIPVPIASLAKMMTALIVLRDHPLGGYSQGPAVEVTAKDAAGFEVDLSTDQSSVPLEQGEVLTERQLLQALLVRSANDVAEMLARWDAGSVAGFVAKMNATAAAMGLRSTTYTDPSGFLPTTVSTAVDQLKVAEAAMALPAFAQIVDEPEVSLPLITGPVANIVSEIGSNGIVGVKSGITNQSGGCAVIAADRSVWNRTVLVIAVVLGQQGGGSLRVAAKDAVALVDSAAKSLEELAPVARGAVVAHVVVPWATTDQRVPVVAASTASVIAWPTERVEVTVLPAKLPARPLSAGSPAGVLVVSAGPQRLDVQLALKDALKGPSFWWRLIR